MCSIAGELRFRPWTGQADCETIGELIVCHGSGIPAFGRTGAAILWFDAGL